MLQYTVAETPAVYRLPTLPRVSGPLDVADLCKNMRRLRQEQFRVLCLNTKNYVLKRITVAVGSLSAAIVHPREVFRPAIVASAAGVVVVHNHPSGIPEPSHEDQEFTRRLVRAGEVIGISVLDHVVVASGGHYSFKEHGLM